MVAVLDDHLAAVGQAPVPGAEPPAEVRRRLEQLDLHAPLGEHQRGAHARDPAADDEGARLRSHPLGQVGPGAHVVVGSETRAGA